jgi:uncharacterized membrane protein
MLISVIWVIILFNREGTIWLEKIPAWWVPVLSVIGIAVSFYLTYIEYTQAPVVCGPVGDCTSVQQSQYAKLFGLVPIGLVGIIGYLGVMVVWIAARKTSGATQKLLDFILWVLAWLGVLFSIYLTFLEPFVIGATCMWCISSAMVMTLLLWATTGRAKNFWQGDDDDELLTE